MNTKKKGICIRDLSIISIVITVVVAVILILVIMWTNKEFDVIKNSTYQYISAENAVEDMRAASDFMTEQVRLYVMTQDKEHMNLYFEESKVNKRRDGAVDNLKQWYAGTALMDKLEYAFSRSRELMNTEYHSMHLVAAATGEAEESLPEEVRNSTLSAEELAMTSEEKLSLALELVSSRDYQNASESIISGVNSCLNEIMEGVAEKEKNASSIFTDAYRKLKFAVAFLIIMSICMYVSMWVLIVYPLRKYNESVLNNELLKPDGASELRMLADTFNSMYEENQENQRLLRHEADHDELTRVLNRRAFSKMLDILESAQSAFSLIIIDVDYFKSINDTYGHEAGDKVLLRVASELKKAFRSFDYVFRIGGDEFAVIMVDVDEDMSSVISAKLKLVNQILSVAKNGTEAVTLSMGVAFSNYEKEKYEIFKCADLALYDVKENGRNGFAMYSIDNERTGYFKHPDDIKANQEERQPKDDPYRDSQSGIYSREFIEHNIDKVYDCSAVVVLDIDNLSEISDSFGSVAGEMLLKRISLAIKNCIRKNDYLIKMNGNIFMIVFEEMDKELLEDRLEMIRTLIEDIRLEEYPEARTTVSIGGCCSSHVTDEAVKLAEQSMKEGKVVRNRIIVNNL